MKYAKIFGSIRWQKFEKDPTVSNIFECPMFKFSQYILNAYKSLKLWFSPMVSKKFESSMFEKALMVFEEVRKIEVCKHFDGCNRVCNRVQRIDIYK